MKEQVVFLVEGVFCPKCVKKLEDTFAAIPAVSQISVTTDYKEVTVSFEGEEITKAALKEQIEAISEKDFKVLGEKA